MNSMTIILSLRDVLTSHHLEEAMIRLRELNMGNEWISVV